MSRNPGRTAASTLRPAVLIVVAALALLTPASAQQRVFPFPFETVQLENGFRAYLIKAGAPGQIAYITVRPDRQPRRDRRRARADSRTSSST